MNRPAWPLGIALTLSLGLLAPAIPAAQEAQPQTAEQKQAAKEKAKQERIAEYLRKKEERRARREANEKREAEEAAAKQTAKANAESPQANRTKTKKQRSAEVSDSTEVATKRTKKQKKSEPKKTRVAKSRKRALPRGLQRIHNSLRADDFAQDPSVESYLDLIESGDATAQQIAAFGNFLGQAGRANTALAYYDLALSLDDRDPTIWINAGTLQRKAGRLDAAAGAYIEALSIKPDHAYAHYNLGAVLDEMGEYDAAIEEYTLALQHDPTLGDPAMNPQAANNEKLMVVRMKLYKEQAGNLGLPLVNVPKGEIDGGK